MAKFVAVASLWDRLSTFDSEVSPSGLCSRDFYIGSVVRDLESLLNSRAVDLASDGSLVQFGIIDAIGINLLDMRDRHRFVGNIESAIRVHDSRLRDVSVSYVGQRDFGRCLLLEISASLLINDRVERLVFKTDYQPISSVYQVQRG